MENHSQRDWIFLIVGQIWAFRSITLTVFRGPTGIYLLLQLQLPVGLTGICLYSYSSVQLHKKRSLQELFSGIFSSYSYIKKWFSNQKCNDFEKNGKIDFFVFGTFRVSGVGGYQTPLGRLFGVSGFWAL